MIGTTLQDLERQLEEALRGCSRCSLSPATETVHEEFTFCRPCNAEIDRLEEEIALWSPILNAEAVSA